jgi:hypothetical protein
LQELAETFVGCMILRDKYNHVPPFLKQLQALVNSKLDLSDFKVALLKLKYHCPSFNPTHIVDKYPNSWWKMSDLTADEVYPLDGVQEFMQQVSSSL